MVTKRVPQLNNKQRLFVENYLRHGNAKTAAIQAGYAEKSASSKGSYLVNRDKTVMFHLERARKKSEARAVYNYEMAMDEAKEGMEIAKDTENAGAYVNAAKLRAQLTGLLVEKHAIQAGFSIQISGIDDAQNQITGGVVNQIGAGDILSLIGGEDEEEDEG